MRILLIADYKRPDTFDYLIKNTTNHIEWIILWNYKERDSQFLPNVPLIGWSSYRTPKELINNVKPDKIVFFETLDMWQIPLVIYAKRVNVATFYISHGISSNVETIIKRFEEENYFQKVLSLTKRLFSSFLQIIRTRYFYYSVSFSLSNVSFYKFILLPIYFKFNPPVKALSKLKFKERTPDYALLFNENNIPSFYLYNILDRKNIFTSGIPFFDNYYSKKYMEENYLVFIDHPYLELKLLNWNDQFHKKIADTLYSFSKINNIRIVVKLHPRSNIQNWKRYNLPEENIEIIQIQVKEEIYLKARLILGYSSTLVNAFLCAQKNVVLLGWHPAPQIFGIDYSQTNLCYKSLDIDDLQLKYNSWISNNLSEQNREEYNLFLYKYNCPFDGKATERIVNIIRDA